MYRNVNYTLEQAMMTQLGSRFSAALSWTSTLDRARWWTPHPGRFVAGKEIRHPLCGTLGASQGQSGLVWKIWLQQQFDPLTFNPVASRCTDWANPIHFHNVYLHETLMGISHNKQYRDFQAFWQLIVVIVTISISFWNAW